MNHTIEIIDSKRLPPHKPNRTVMEYTIKIDDFISLTFIVFSDSGKGTYFVVNPIKNVALELDIQKHIRITLYQQFLKDTFGA